MGVGGGKKAVAKFAVRVVRVHGGTPSQVGARGVEVMRKAGGVYRYANKSLN